MVYTVRATCPRKKTELVRDLSNGYSRSSRTARDCQS